MPSGGARPGAGRKSSGRPKSLAVGAGLRPRDAERLAELAAELQITRSELVRRILESFLTAETWVRKGL